MIPVFGSAFYVRVVHHGSRRAGNTWQSTQEKSSAIHLLRRGESAQMICESCGRQITGSALTIGDAWKFRLSKFCIALAFALLDALSIAAFMALSRLTDISALFGICYFFVICGAFFCTFAALGSLTDALFSQGVIAVDETCGHSLSVRFAPKS